MNIRHFSDADVLRLLTPEMAREAVLGAFSAWFHGDASTAQRSRCAVGSQLCSSMIAVVPPYSGGKIYSTTAGRFVFLTVLFDKDGQLLATFDGDMLTRLRTSALVGAAIEQIHPTVSTRLGIVGAGKQSQLIVMEAIRVNKQIHKVLVFDVVEEAAKQLVSTLRVMGLEASIERSPRDVARQSDTVVTATSSKKPVLDHGDLERGSLIVGVGATKDGLCELAPTLIGSSSQVICDDVEGSRLECGDLLEASRAGTFDWSTAVELKDIFGGRVPVQRGLESLIIFETQGVAIQDVAVAGVVWEAAQI